MGAAAEYVESLSRFVAQLAAVVDERQDDPGDDVVDADHVDDQLPEPDVDEPDVDDSGAVDSGVDDLPAVAVDQDEQQRIAAMLSNPAAANAQALSQRRKEQAAAGRASAEQMSEIYALSERAGMSQAVVDEQIVAQQRLRRIEDLTTEKAAAILRALRSKLGRK